MKVASYRELRVWQAGMDLVEALYKITACFPKHEAYGLAGQIQRAVVSIPSNIAEVTRASTLVSTFSTFRLHEAPWLKWKRTVRSPFGLVTSIRSNSTTFFFSCQIWDHNSQLSATHFHVAFNPTLTPNL